MVVVIKEDSKKMLLRDKECIIEVAEGSIPGVGKLVNFMDMEYWNRRMEEYIKDILKMILNMDLVSMLDLMVEYTKETGL